ncbi:agmatinase [Comamonas sp. JC664]|uniref:agmatinase n=1 Tax=Comamonas sp. JC664 TaxID=2801917 RepID=UPI00174A87AC|nr:agmatinase [Comamonas sp. JC664]MBL0693179.1 agmatinase [Comamonas sp. JC664]GHG97214.1 agmatinase [Comamonas sp. KCTC 72670]
MQGQDTYPGATGFLRCPFTRDLTGVDIAIVGVPYDLASTHRPGARFGPSGLRAASNGVAATPWPWGFNPLKRMGVIDYGDFAFDPGRPQEVPAHITWQAHELLERGISLVAMGGDHFISYPLLRAYAQKHGPLALVQFDAHSDTWPGEEGRISHGTMFHHAVKEGLILPEHSVQIGIRTFNADPLGLTWLDADQVHERGAAWAASEVHRIVGGHKAYLSFDIDCLDPSCAPGTGTPVVGGLTTQQARAILRRLDGIEFVGMDLVEVSPPYDTSGITALAGATLMLDYLCLRALHREEARPLPSGQ